MAYPVLRARDYIPTDFLLELTRNVSDDRAGSLGVRFEQEQLLLARASERFWFGWGRFGRSRIYNEYGGDDTLSDGYWIVAMGQFGFVGFLAEFCLLALPVLKAAGTLKLPASKRDRLFLSALALILAINVFDLLPNASIRPWTWLIAGALLGRAEQVKTLASKRLPSRTSSAFDSTPQAAMFRSNG